MVVDETETANLSDGDEESLNNMLNDLREDSDEVDTSDKSKN